MRLNTRVLATVGLLLCTSLRSMAAVPDDTSTKGPSIVGARTVKIKNLDVEVWYPSSATTAPATPKNYDLRVWLPPAEQKKIPDDKVPAQVCDCFANLPIDNSQAPYPVILFAHGTAAFRTQTLSLMTHLASRGFVVLAADHPGLYLGDLLQFKLNAKVTTDLQNIIAALRNQDPAVAFLKDQVDTNHIGLIGHSAGGNAVASGSNWPGVELVVPMAAGGTQKGNDLKGSLIMGALDDKVVGYSRQQSGFTSSPSPKRLIGLKNAGHLAFSDLCALKNKDGEDLVAVAQKYKISNAGFATSLWDGCAAGQLDPFKSRQILNYSIAAAAEEALLGIDHATAFKNLKTRYAEVSEFKEAL